MLKTSKLISLLLVVAMILSVFSVGVVATGAADATVAANVIHGGTTEAAHVGDKVHYQFFIDTSEMTTVTDSKMNNVTFVIHYDHTKLKIDGTATAPALTVNQDINVDNVEDNEIWVVDYDINAGVVYGPDVPLLDINFEIIGEGDSTLTYEIETLSKNVDGRAVTYIQRFAPVPGMEQPNIFDKVDITCPHTVEEPTEAPFDPETQLAVTLVGFDGERETKIFNIGDKFTVYGYLCTKEIDNGKLAALDCEEDYDVSKVKLLDEWDPDDDGMFYDLEKVYPVTGDDTISNAAKSGRIIFNASKARGFNFKNADSQLIVTDYEAIAPGETTIELKVKILARVGAEVEKIVNKYVVQPGFRFVQHLTFDPDYQAPDLPAPTEAATEAETVAETEAPVVPTDAPTANVKIYDFNGNLCDTKTFNVGDTFDVYTTLNAYNTAAKGKIASFKADQTYTKDVLALASPLDAEQMLGEDAFPIFGSAAMGRLTEEGRILYNASTPSIENPFKFNTDDDVVIVTKYTVTAGGDAEVHNALITLGAADEDLTRLVKNGVAEDGVVLSSVASFAQPEAQADPVEPTEAPEEPTEAPAPADTYVVAGKPASILGVEWNPTAEANAMTFANDVWSKEYTVSEAVNDVQLKAVKNGTTWIGDETGNNVTFNLNGAGTFTVYCDGTKTWVEGDNVEFPSGLDVESVTLVGNGSTDGDNWLNNITWDPAAAANHMTEVADGVYEIEFTLGKYDTSDPEFKFAINDDWTHNFGLGDNGVIANGVETDAIYNGSQNLKITGLTEGTNIKAQLDLTGFDFDSKTGAKMTITWTAPTEPTEAPAVPTEAPAEPTTAPAEPTEAPGTEAIVTIYGLDGESETKTFQVGETFTVYTTLNTSEIEGGKIASMSGTQTYTDSILTLADEYSDVDGAIADLDAMFPITKDATVANGKGAGIIRYNASTPSIQNAFLFDSDSSLLIVTHYTVTAPGTAEVRNAMRTLAVADENLTPIIYKSEVKNDNFRMHAQYDAPVQPTEAPAEPTDAPVEPTDAPVEPTDAPVEPTTAPAEPTDAPVEPTTAPVEPTDAPLTQATVHIFDIYGQETDVETYDIGQTFTVYTLLNAKDIQNGKIAALSGTQTYDPAILALADAVENGEIKNLTEVFPITGEKSLGNAETPGTIIFNASTPSIENPFLFNRDDSVLIKTQYTVTKGGDTEIHTTLKTLASADEDLTRIISKGEVADNNFTESMVFELPEVPTEAPAEPTTAPVEPTEAPAEPTDAPVEPTTAPVEPTTAPVEPTTAPVEPTDAPLTQATVHIFDIYGQETDVETYDIGQTFTVYTLLNAKDIQNGKIAALSGTQTYDPAILALADAVENGEIKNLTEVFPITGEKSLGNAETPGTIIFNASTPSIENPFLFNRDDSVLIKTQYTVTKGGDTEIHTTLKTLASADEDLTRIIVRGDVVDNNFTESMVFELPEVPTEAPAEPTTAPVEPTTAPVEPTDAPVEPTTAPVEPTTAPVEPTTAPVEPTTAPVEPTTAPVEPTTAPVEPTTAPVEPTTAPAEPTTAPAEPTEAPKATITIYSLDGSSETKEFNVGDTFTVYTTLNVKDSAPDGIASINASQTYSNDILALDKTASAETMFPILKDSALVNLDQDGKVLYNASTPKIENAFRFNSNDDLLIVTTYTVTAPGTGEVRNAIKTMAAADDMLTPIVKRGEIQPDKGLSQITSFDAPIPEPTEAPVEPTTAPVEPTTAPVEPTTAPVEPTTAPVEPTTAPVEPTTAPVEPTTAPVEPTTAPVEPTTAPVEPTTAPVEPTTAPVEPTTAPVEPTTAPVEPTTAPVEPTTAPVEPTTAPVEPTTAPSGDTVFINADGNIYEVEIGSEHVYTFYLNNGGKVCGVDASTTWDAPVLSMVGDPSFPNLDDSLVVNSYVDLVDEEGNLVEQVVYFNYTNADGADFDNDEAKLITFTVKVAENATPGETYYITTNIKTLEGEDEEKQIYEDSDITPEKITRREGVLDNKAPDKKAENKYTVNDETYVKGSNESKLFTVNGEVDDERTFGKFRALYIDGALVDYSNYTKESGSLKLTLLPAYMETLEVGEHEMRYVFSDGEATGKLTVVEGEKPTTGPTVAPTTAPTSKVTPTSGTNGSGTSTNGSAVKTGSPEMAIIFMIILVMAAGIIVFTKKRRED